MKYTLAYGKGQLEFSLPDEVRPRTIVPGSRPGRPDPLAETEAVLQKPIGSGRGSAQARAWRLLNVHARGERHPASTQTVRRTPAFCEPTNARSLGIEGKIAMVTLLLPRLMHLDVSIRVIETTGRNRQ